MYIHVQAIQTKERQFEKKIFLHFILLSVSDVRCLPTLRYCPVMHVSTFITALILHKPYVL